MSIATPSTTPPADTNTIVPLMLDAKSLGMLLIVSEKTIRRWDRSGKIPRPIRVTAAVVRWSRETIVRWLAECEQAGRLIDRREWESLQNTNNRNGQRR